MIRRERKHFLLAYLCVCIGHSVVASAFQFNHLNILLYIFFPYKEHNVHVLQSLDGRAIRVSVAKRQTTNNNQDVVPFKCKGINFQQFIGDTELSFIPFGVDILVFSFKFFF